MLHRLSPWTFPPMVAALLALSAACGSTTQAARPTTTVAVGPNVVVASYNVDLGADLAPLFRLKGMAQVLAAAKTAWQDVIASSYSERAVAIAQLLTKERPDVIGLQEADSWETRDPSQAGSAFTMLYDFTALIRADLAADGVPYDTAVLNRNEQAEMPLDAKTVVRYSDYNVILTRSGLPKQELSTSNPAEGKYTAGIPLGAPISAVMPTLTRGWASVDVAVSGHTFRFFTTHLEGYTSAGKAVDYYLAQQANELAAMVTASPYPAVVTGDVNTAQPGCPFPNSSSSAYETLAATGLTEVWPALHPQDRCGGMTSGQRTLRWPTSTLDHRIDDIFFMPARMEAVTVLVIGDQQSDRTPSGLWPSDHAASVATLRFKAA